MTKIFLASTLFGTTTLAAAVDEGRFGPHDEPWLLLTWKHATAAEVYPSVETRPGFESVARRFDRVVSFNDTIAPLHPGGWGPPSGEIPLLSRMLRHEWGIEDEVSELVVESLGARTSQALATILRDCPISVYADGFMGYSPTRNALPLDFGGRITRLLHLPLAPGVQPLLLREFHVEPEPISTQSFVDVVRELPGSTDPEMPAGAPMLVGQYLASLEILTPGEENALHARAVHSLAAAGHDTVVFKPHPAAARSQIRALQRQADDLGVALHVAPPDEPVEVLFRDHPPVLVVAAFSTALGIARECYGLPVASIDGELILERLTPYQNSNRIPATIVDASMPRLLSDGSLNEPDAVPLDSLVEAVGYCMQSTHLPELRTVAATHINRWGRARYFKKKRLESLGLMAKPAPKPVAGTTATTATKAAAGPRPGAGSPVARRADALRAAALERIRRRTTR